MSKRNIFLMVFMLLVIIYAIHSARIGPLDPRFCDLFEGESSNKYADLVRKLNSYSICKESQYDIFEKYIYWNGEIIAGVFKNVLVFKGSDTIQDWIYDITFHKSKRLVSNIELIYDDIKDRVNKVINDYNITHLTGWSLGAVISCMCALDTHHNIEKIVLFGLPNIFSNDFVDMYNSKLGNKTTVYNHRFDIFVNAFGYGKTRNHIKQTFWINPPALESHKLLTKGLGHFHLSYMR